MSENEKKRDWRDNSYGLSIVCVGGLVSLYSLITIGHYWDTGWGADQWGPIASWFAAIATVAAVGVALFQTKLARDDAAREAAEIKDRFQSEMDEADRRHKAELRAASREAEQRRLDDRRSEHYDSVKLVSVAAHKARSSIAAYQEMSETKTKGDILADSISTAEIFERRDRTLSTLNESAIDMTLALIRMTDQSLRDATIIVRNHLSNAVGKVSGPDAVDWAAARAEADNMNVAQLNLQVVAGDRLQPQVIGGEPMEADNIATTGSHKV